MLKKILQNIFKNLGSVDHLWLPTQLWSPLHNFLDFQDKLQLLLRIIVTDTYKIMFEVFST